MITLLMPRCHAAAIIATGYNDAYYYATSLRLRCHILIITLLFIFDFHIRHFAPLLILPLITPMCALFRLLLMMMPRHIITPLRFFMMFSFRYISPLHSFCFAIISPRRYDISPFRFYDAFSLAAVSLLPLITPLRLSSPLRHCRR